MSIAWLSPQIILMSLSEVRKFKVRGAGGGGVSGRIKNLTISHR